MWWNYYWPMPWFGALFMILAIAFCVAMMFMMMRGMMDHRGSQSDHYDLQILKERYARGEITKAEYEERRQVLQG
jgi:putative membrane protein